MRISWLTTKSHRAILVILCQPRSPTVDRIYLAYYRGRTIEVKAPNSYTAQNLAAVQFGVRKSYQVAVVLADQPVDTASVG